MRKFKYIFIIGIISLISFFFGSLISFSSQAQTEDDTVIASFVLAKLSQNSKDWPEVVAYKNAFDYLKSHVNNKNRISTKIDYFSKLSSTDPNNKTIFCMSLSQPPRDCYFRNIESNEILDIIEKRMKEDNLTKEDIKKAINDIPSKKNPTKFTP